MTVTDTEVVLEADGLTKHFPVRRGVRDLLTRDRKVVHAVDDISFAIAPGEALALVGESGCGKSTTGRLVLALLAPTSGVIRFDGAEITGRGPRDLKDLRRRAQIVFQDPYASFDPRRRVGS